MEGVGAVQSPCEKGTLHVEGATSRKRKKKDTESTATCGNPLGKGAFTDGLANDVAANKFLLHHSDWGVQVW